MARALGLDGCPTGWVAVLLVGGELAEVAVLPDAATAFSRFQPDLVAVDIPIGLVDGEDREADTAARRFLGRGGSSVFNAPARSVVMGSRDGTVTEYAEALLVSQRVAGKGLSQQSWRLVPKIAELDELVFGGTVPVLEVHPEVCFRLLAGQPLARKHSWNGLSQRRRLLETRGLALPETVDGGERCAPDDVVDATVVAWTAARTLSGATMRRFPEAGAQTDRGRRVEIVAAD